MSSGNEQLQLQLAGKARTPVELKRVEDKLRAIVQGSFRAAAIEAAACTLEQRRHQQRQAELAPVIERAERQAMRERERQAKRTKRQFARWDAQSLVKSFRAEQSKRGRA